MHSLIEFCPHCDCRRELDVSLGLAAVNSPNGIEEVLLYHYYCASCNTYVRSTTLDNQEYISPKEAALFPISEYA